MAFTHLFFLISFKLLFVFLNYNKCEPFSFNNLMEKRKYCANRKNKLLDLNVEYNDINKKFLETS